MPSTPSTPTFGRSARQREVEQVGGHRPNARVHRAQDDAVRAAQCTAAQHMHCGAQGKAAGHVRRSAAWRDAGIGPGCHVHVPDDAGRCGAPEPLCTHCQRSRWPYLTGVLPSSMHCWSVASALDTACRPWLSATWQVGIASALGLARPPLLLNLAAPPPGQCYKPACLHGPPICNGCL